MESTIRIGEILIEQGILSEQQVLEIVQAQKQRHEPFGVLAEKMFDVTVQSIENAWIEQYHRYTGTINLGTLNRNNFNRNDIECTPGNMKRDRCRNHV